MTKPPPLSQYAVLLDPSDNVATALREIPPGVYARDAKEPIELTEAIPSAFKLAIEPIARGAVIRKYGYPIGTAMAHIAPGEQVHVHNLASTVGDAAEGEHE